MLQPNPNPTWISGPELDVYFNRLFTLADTNGDGVLQPMEFLEVLSMSGLGLPAKLILDLFQEADTNHDGVVEYGEFVPAMAALVLAEQEAQSHGDTRDPVWEYRIFVPITNRSREDVERVKRRVVADQIGRRGRRLGHYAHSDSYSAVREGFCVESPQGFGARSLTRVERDANGAEVWSTSLFSGGATGAEQELTKQTERYLVGGCVVEMSLIKLLFAMEGACDTYATFCFQGEDKEAVYEAALKAGVISLKPYALCGDGTADSTLGAMGMSYAGFLGRRPSQRTPPAVAPAQRTSQRSGAQQRQGGIPLPDSELTMQRYLERLFKLGDTNGDGVLDKDEMKRLLHASGFQFSDLTISSLMQVADANEDGVVQYEEFLPLMTGLLMQ